MTDNLKEQLKRNVEAYLIEQSERPRASRRAWKAQLLELAGLLGTKSVADVKEALKE